MQGDEPVVDPRAVEIDAEHDRAHDAAKPALAAGHGGPAERDGEQHRGEREREQREIDAAPAQDEKAREPGEHRDRRDRKQRRDHDVAGKPVALRQRGRIGGKAVERAVAERHEAGGADQDVQPHAGDGEDHHVGRGGERQADGGQHEGQQHAATRRRPAAAYASARIAVTRTSGCVRRTGRADGTAAPAPSGGTSRLRSRPARSRS